MKKLKSFKLFEKISKAKAYNDIDLDELKAAYKKLLQEFNDGFLDDDAGTKIGDAKYESFVSSVVKLLIDRVQYFDWNTLDVYMDQINLQEYDTEDTLPIILNFMNDNPMFFSKKVQDVNDKTGVFESNIFEENENGRIAKMVKYIRDEMVYDILVDEIKKYCENKISFEFGQKINAKYSSSCFLHVKIGGVSFLVEDLDHFKLYKDKNDPRINEVFHNPI